MDLAAQAEAVAARHSGRFFWSLEGEGLAADMWALAEAGQFATIRLLLERRPVRTIDARVKAMLSFARRLSDATLRRMAVDLRSGGGGSLRPGPGRLALNALLRELMGGWNLGPPAEAVKEARRLIAALAPSEPSPFSKRLFDDPISLIKGDRSAAYVEALAGIAREPGALEAVGPEIKTMPSPETGAPTRYLVWRDRRAASTIDELVEVSKVPLGVMQLRGWWLVNDGRSIQKARRWPETEEAVREAYDHYHGPGASRQLEEKWVERYALGGRVQNRAIAYFVQIEGRELQEAIHATKRVEIEVERDLIAAYGTAFATAAGQYSTSAAEDAGARRRWDPLAGRPGIHGGGEAETPAKQQAPTQASETTVRVGRWMSQTEYDAMVKTGMVQQTRGGPSTHVALPANRDAFGKQAGRGSLYVEFDVPSSSVKPTSRGWGAIPGPASPDARLAARRGQPIPQMPAATNIDMKGTKP